MHLSRNRVRLAAASVAATLSLATAFAQSEQPPKAGGTLEIGTVYVTLSALSWDSADWNWKHNHDTGAVYEQLFVADLSKSKRLGGKHPFYADAWIPSDAIRGELAETWAWKQNPLRLEINLRKGVMFPEKPGVMAARELVADDVVFAYNRLEKSPKKIAGYFDSCRQGRGDRQAHRGVHLQETTTPNGTTALAGAITPAYAEGSRGRRRRQLEERQRHRPVHARPISCRATPTPMSKNPNYWDKEKINGVEIQAAAGRQGSLSHHQGRGDVPHRAANRQARHPRKHPLVGRRRTEEECAAIAVVEMAVDERVSSWRCASTPSRSTTSASAARSIWRSTSRRSSRNITAAMPSCSPIRSIPTTSATSSRWRRCPTRSRSSSPTIRRRRRSCSPKPACPRDSPSRCRSAPAIPDHMDLLPLVAAYLEQVGVKIEIQPMEYGAFLSAMTSKTNAPGYLMGNGHTNPTTTIRKSFVKGQVWNPSQWNDPEYDKKMDAVYLEQDESKRQAMLKEMTREILDKAPYVWLPTPYIFTAWWPWVKNYGGELRAGSVRPGPIYARIWIDQELKKKLGY
jgi:peptide/nickel transport system substrate-binding protein